MARMHGASTVGDVDVDAKEDEEEAWKVHRGNVKREQLLQSLQGSIHFEKILTKSNTDRPGKKSCLLGLPVWFVLEHGDKFQRDVVLRSGSSPKPWMPWDVRLSVHVRYSTYPDVNFSYGWKGFSAACDLRVGDSLIFLLTEFSEFEVHVFRRTENPDVSSLLTGENQGDDSDLFREKVSKSHGSTSRYMPTESFVELVPHDSCGSIEKRGTIGGEGAVSASPGGTSLKNSNCNMTTKGNEQSTAMRTLVGTLECQVQPTVHHKENAIHFPKTGRFGQHTSKSPEVAYFKKTITPSNVDRNNKKFCSLLMPKWFVLQHGDKFQRSVVLRSGSSAKPWQPWNVVVKMWRRPECENFSPRVAFTAGWKDFATFCGLRIGDAVVFNLRKLSEFDVHVVRGVGTSMPSAFQGPRNWDVVPEPLQEIENILFTPPELCMDLQKSPEHAGGDHQEHMISFP